MRKRPESNAEKERSSTTKLVPQGELEHELAIANDPHSLKLLGDKVAAVQELARRANLALEELNRLSETRLRVARKLGAMLQESVRRGGRSKGHDVTSIRGGSSSPIPEGITRKQSSRLQHFAEIPDEHFERYIRETWERHELITFAGFWRSARRYAIGLDQVPPRTASDAYWDKVWDAVTRVTELDVSVGRIPIDVVGAGKCLKPLEGIESQLGGNVLVRTGKDVEIWLRKLAEGRQAGDIFEAMILFPARTGQRWVRLIETGRWTCCFLEKPESMSISQALAYLGERKHTFAHVFRGLGGVLAGQEF